MPIKSINTIFKEIDAIEDNKIKLAELKKLSNNIAIKTVLKYAFDPKIKFDLPEGSPPFKEIGIDAQESALYRECRKLYIFVKPNPQIKTVDIPKIKREMLFIDLLESIAPDDARLLIAIKDKQFPYKTITLKLVKKAFPEIF